MTLAPPFSWRSATIVALRDVTPTVREFELVPADGPVLSYSPGAHLQLQVLIGTGTQARVHTRSYSLVGEPTGDRYRIAVKRLDPGREGSLALWRLSVGDRINLSAPQNFFSLDTTAPAYLLVAGGIGVTPIVAMAQRLAALHRQTGVPVHLLYGARSAMELAYLDDLKQALGDAITVDVSGAGFDLGQAIAKLPAGGQVYTCGPAPMLEAVKRAWQQAGRPEPDLRYETFGNSGRFATQAFQVRVPRHGLDITVDAGSSLLEALESAGVACLSDCRRGECGLCVTPVLGVDGDIDHRDVFLSEHEKQRNTQMCICVSRVVGSVTLDSAYRPDGGAQQICHNAATKPIS